MANLQSLIKQHNPKVLTDGKKLIRLCNFSIRTVVQWSVSA